MHEYLIRHSSQTVINRLKQNPAVALLGARQVGKSTLAKHILVEFPNAIYLDLERPSDLNKLNDAEAFLTHFSKQLICIDEIQRAPELFSILRSVIDQTGTNAQFLLLGSASRDLIRQTSESLAGRISYIEISPFTLNEVPHHKEQHWLHGGYPRSLLSSSSEDSFQWREDYIRTFLERDVPQLGFNIPANTLGRFWRMLAHTQGQLLNASTLAGSMGVSSHTIRKYIDLLEQTFVIRSLAPYTANIGKRLIKSPKIFIRDTGILHALLDIETHDDLFSHPVYGASFESYIIENILINMPRWKACFYRSSHGAEIDLVLTRGQQTLAIEIKASTSPKVSKGFWSALEVVKPDKTYIIAPVTDDYIYTKKNNVWVISLSSFLQREAFG